MTPSEATTGRSGRVSGSHRSHPAMRRFTRWPLALAAALLTACQAIGPHLAPTTLRPVTAAGVSVQTPVRSTLPADYYNAATGQTGQSLITALHGIIAKHTDLGYDGARDVMFGDLDDTTHKDTVQSVYTGEWITGVKDRNTASARGFNTEHTWPQSLGAENVAKDDLHHLYSVDTKTNGIRSSFPFGIAVDVLILIPDVSHTGQASKLGKDASGVQVFEPPDWHKGDVARSLMYFFTCYAASANAIQGGGPLSLANFNVERKVLLQWNKLDPVDDTERQRNDAIFDLQKNRNPFVDHPEFAEQAGPEFLPK